jgi:hypothetical protein
MNRMCLLVLVGLGLAHVACGRKAPERRSCPFAGSIKAADGRVGATCTAQMKLWFEDDWRQVNSLPGSTGGSFQGSIGAVTAGPVTTKVRFVVLCEGYQERSRDFAWDLVPGQCRDLPLGDFLVSPVIKP